MIPKGSKPSSSASSASHTNDDTRIPSNLSLDLVMNWVQGLATIDCLAVDISGPMEDVRKEKELDDSIDDVVGTPMEVETLEKMMEIFIDDEDK